MRTHQITVNIGFTNAEKLVSPNFEYVYEYLNPPKFFYHLIFIHA